MSLIIGITLAIVYIALLSYLFNNILTLDNEEEDDSDT